MNCEICESLLVGKEKRFCKICNNRKFEIVCPVCDKKRNVTPAYFVKTKGIAECASCSRKGEKSKDRIAKKLATEKEKRANGYKRTVSEDGRQRMGIASSKKFTEEYKLRIRKIFETAGKWTPIEQVEDYELYYKLANWKNQPITDYTVGVELLKDFPMFSKMQRSSTSLVRDHMYSRKKGFYDKVFPEILRHPANCQIMHHVDNFNKGKRKDDCSITLDELFNRIKSWPIPYVEQEKCLNLIVQYQNGERYERNNNKIYTT